MSALKVGDKLFDVSFVSDSRPVQDGGVTRLIIDGRGHFEIEAHTVTRVTPKFFWIRTGSDEGLASGRSLFRPDHVERGDRAAFEASGDVIVNRRRFYDREHAETALAKVLASEAERGLR